MKSHTNHTKLALFTGPATFKIDSVAALGHFDSLYDEPPEGKEKDGFREAPPSQARSRGTTMRCRKICGGAFFKSPEAV